MIKFLRPKKNNFIWPNIEDKSLVDNADILRILPQPTEDRKGTGFTFNGKFDGMNICY